MDNKKIAQENHLKLYIQGINGRVGSKFYEEIVKNHADIEILNQEDKFSNTKNQSKSQKFVNYPALENADAIIDFSSTSGIDNFTNLKNKVFIIGTTGGDLTYQNKINDLAKNNKVFYSPNMSFGIYIMSKLIQQIQQFYKKFNIENEILILETHHKNKKDAPSGTAKMLIKLIENSEKLNVNSIRFSDIQGSHNVVFDNINETLEVKHTSKNLGNYLHLSLFAATNLQHKPNRIYTMDDIVEMILNK